MQAEIQRGAGESLQRGHRSATAATREYSAAQQRIEALRREGRLNETQIVEFAKSGRFEELVAALALLCAVPIEVVDRLMRGDRPDPILILVQIGGLEMADRQGGHHGAVRPATRHRARASTSAFANFERLSAATATARHAVLADAAGRPRRDALNAPFSLRRKIR